METLASGIFGRMVQKTSGIFCRMDQKTSGILERGIQKEKGADPCRGDRKMKMTVAEVHVSMVEDYGDNQIIDVEKVFVFANGNVVVFDTAGKQVAFLQGLLSGAFFEKQKV